MRHVIQKKYVEYKIQVCATAEKISYLQHVLIIYIIFLLWVTICVDLSYNNSFMILNSLLKRCWSRHMFAVELMGLMFLNYVIHFITSYYICLYIETAAPVVHRCK